MKTERRHIQNNSQPDLLDKISSIQKALYSGKNLVIRKTLIMRTKYDDRDVAIIKVAVTRGEIWFEAQFRNGTVEVPVNELAVDYVYSQV